MPRKTSPVTKALARLSCLMGRHDRSRSQAVRYADNSVLSLCRHCGKAMFRHPREGWMVERRAEQRCFERAGRGPKEEGDDGDEAADRTEPDVEQG